MTPQRETRLFFHFSQSERIIDMSEKQFEECSLQNATHVEVNGVVYNVAGNICRYNIGLGWVKENTYISEELFSTLGIKPLREKKREPIEFEAEFVKHDFLWHPLYSLNGLFYRNPERARFKCVQILEED